MPFLCFKCAHLRWIGNTGFPTFRCFCRWALTAIPFYAPVVAHIHIIPHVPWYRCHHSCYSSLAPFPANCGLKPWFGRILAMWLKSQFRGYLSKERPPTCCNFCTSKCTPRPKLTLGRPCGPILGSHELGSLVTLGGPKITGKL